MSRIESFLELYRSPNTIKVYRANLKKYFHTFYPDDSLDEAVEKYFSQPKNDEDYEHDVNQFYVTVKDVPPISLKVAMSVVKSFLIENEVELSERYWRNLKRRRTGTGPISEDRIPTPDELKRILSQMPLNMRAFFLVLVSSGMRGGEALSIKLSDLCLNLDPPRIRLRATNTKNGTKHTAFLSQEAKTHLEEWLKTRNAFLTHYGKSVDDDRVFPFKSNNIRKVWFSAVLKTGLVEKDSVTGRLTLHPHCLRKYMRTQMAEEISADLVEALIGHSGYMTGSYRKYSEETLATYYKKAEHKVTILGEVKGSEELSEVVRENIRIRREVDEMKKAMEEKYNDLLAFLSMSNEDMVRLKHRIDELKSHNYDPELNPGAILPLVSNETTG